MGGTRVAAMGTLEAGGDRLALDIIGVAAAAGLDLASLVGVGGTFEATFRTLSVALMAGGRRGMAIIPKRAD